MKKKMPFALYNLLLCALALYAAVLVCLCAESAEERWYMKWDLSQDRISDLSEYTVERLGSLDSDVYIYPVYSAGTVSALRDLQEETLRRMAAQCPMLHVSYVDPAGEPQRISALNAGKTAEEGTVFVQDARGTRTVRLLPEDFLFSRRIGEEIYTIYTGEARLIGAVSHVCSPARAHAVFITGHGEAAAEECASLTLQLEAVGLRVLSSDLNTLTAGSDDVLVMIDPRTDLSPAEQQTLANHLDGGGALLLCCGADTPFSALPGLQAVCALYGLGMQQGWVVEDAASVQGYIDRVDWLTPRLSEDNPLIDRLPERVILPRAAALTTPAYRPGVAVEQILLTSDSAVRRADLTGRADERGEGDETGAYLLAAFASNSAGMRFLLVGSADCLREGDWMDASGNAEFISSCLLRMTHQEVTYSLDAGVKRLPAHTIRFPDARTRLQVSGMILAVLPCALLVCMAAVLLKRRRL